MKNKLYNFLDKRRAIIYLLAIASLLCAQWSLGSNEDLYRYSVLAFMPFCFAIVFLMFVDDAKVRRRWQDQHNSSSPHWNDEERKYFIVSVKNTFAAKLDQLATASGTSAEEVLCRAIGLYAEALRQAEEGKIIEFVEVTEDSNPMNDHQERETVFLRDLSELTRKHGLVLESTDAALVDAASYRFPFGDETIDLASGGYEMSPTRAAVQWINSHGEFAMMHGRKSHP